MLIFQTDYLKFTGSLPTLTAVTNPVSGCETEIVDLYSEHSSTHHSAFRPGYIFPVR